MWLIKLWAQFLWGSMVGIRNRPALTSSTMAMGSGPTELAGGSIGGDAEGECQLAELWWRWCDTGNLPDVMDGRLVVGLSGCDTGGVSS